MLDRKLEKAVRAVEQIKEGALAKQTAKQEIPQKPTFKEEIYSHLLQEIKTEAWSLLTRVNNKLFFDKGAISDWEDRRAIHVARSTANIIVEGELVVDHRQEKRTVIQHETRLIVPNLGDVIIFLPIGSLEVAVAHTTKNNDIVFENFEFHALYPDSTNYLDHFEDMVIRQSIGIFRDRTSY